MNRHTGSRSLPACAALVCAAGAFLFLTRTTVPSAVAQGGRMKAHRIAPGPVTVRVKSADGGAPVPSVTVHLGGRYAATGPDGTLVLDGVPEGAYQLVIEHDGFDRVEKKVVLPAGKREWIDVALTPTPFVPFSGIVTLDGTGMPLPGARIVLTPKTVASAIHGSVALATSWDGKFSIIGIPPGKYRAAVSAPGCVAAVFEVEVKPDAGEVNLKLRPESTEANLKVTVLDAATGSPVPGAKVTLAETWPKGKIGEGRTDAAGEALFRNIRIGRLNWADKAGAVSVYRRQVTVHAEAAEYEPTVVGLSLGEKTSVTVRVNPARKVQEAEDNNVIASAQPIRTGAPIEFTISTPRDVDWFRFRIDYPALVRIAVGPNIPIELHTVLHSISGERLNASGAHAGGAPVIERWLPAGEYAVMVEDWRRRNSSEIPIPLVVTRTIAPDPNEPNDTFQTARMLQTSEEVRGCIAPVGDADFFRFETKRPGIVRLLMPACPLSFALVLHGAAGNRIGGANVYANHNLELSRALDAGAYVVEVRAWGNSASFDPYTLRLEFIGDDGINDPPKTPGRVSAVRSLRLGEFVGQTILPPRDNDMYSLSVPSAGVVHVGVSRTQGTILWLLSPDGATLASGDWWDAPQPGHLAWHAPGPTTVFVRISDWGNDNWSPSPYILWAWWAPCDEMELMGRNDKIEDATPIEIAEVARGSIMPARDVDVYRIEVDQPAVLRVEASHTTLQMKAVVRDAKRNVIAEWGRHGWPEWEEHLPCGTGPREMEVFPGEYFIELRESYNYNSDVSSYALRLGLSRAEPGERLPLATDPPRRLKLGEAQPFVFDHVGDCDRFAFSMTEAGKFVVRLRNPLSVHVSIFDELTGEKAYERAHHANTNPRIEIEAKGPTRYLMELRVRGNNSRSPQPHYVLVDMQGRDIAAETIETTLDPCDPTLVRFIRKPFEGLGGARKAMLDADGDGKTDLELPPGGGAEWRYRTEGVYAAVASLENANGTSTIVRFWVEAVGPRERKGIHIVADYPTEGQIVERDVPSRARAMSYTGARIANISASVNGRLVGTVYSAPYRFEIPWRTLGPGRHVLTVTASDTGGEQAVLTRNFQVSEYFGLLPEDGAVVTGNDVRVSWAGTAFGPTTVRYRMKGEEAWKEVVGESGRNRAVLLDGLEPGKQYEFQPLGGKEPGPVRTVTRVKGLAFGKTKYAATIKRDYDQRVAISVRNHGEKPLTVRLECGKPPEESLLLVGFVGEGSEGVPFNLNPGEEREFMLGISAQDCVVPKVAFPIRLVSTDLGLSDESLVEVDVILPNVVLEWEDKGEIPGRIGRRLLLRNKGDSLTDLSLSSSTDDLFVSPYIAHGIFPAGASMEVRAVPRLYDGFQSVEGRIIAKAVNKTSEIDLKIALKEGEKIYAVDLGPSAEDPETEALQRERALAAAYMNPDDVDWSMKTNPQDTDGDGKIDRWTVDVPAESTRWIGNDSNGDGEIDFAQADVGFDGYAEFSAMRGKKGWEETNLVDAHFEMGFKLPWARSAYEKHDVDIVKNGVVIGQLRDAIPDGNYVFRIPPSAFKFGDDGSPAGNEINIRTKHLSGGHFVVARDLRMKLNLTGTRVYAAAKTREEAEKMVRATPGLVLDAPDMSISSREMRIAGEPKSGSPITVSAPLRNLGAGLARRVEVALRFNAGGEDIELARTAIAELAPLEVYHVSITAPAPAGEVALKLVVDPEKRTGDSDLNNNEARAPFSAAGDTTKPTLTVSAPADGASLAEPVVGIVAKAEDDTGIGRVDIRVNDGLWTQLSRAEAAFEGKSLLQPGAHRLTVRAMDTSGNIEAKTVNVTVNAVAPKVEIVEPAEGAQVNARKINVVARCGAEAVRIAARVNGGPWIHGTITGGRATIGVGIPFGAVRIEVMVVDRRGVRGTAVRNVQCTRQPTEEEIKEEATAAAGRKKQAPLLDVPGIGAVDPFGAEIPVFTGPDAASTAATPPVAAGEGATRTDPRAIDDEPGLRHVPIASPEESAEKTVVPDEPGEDGNYGGAPPEGADPAALEGLDEEEAALDTPEGDDENMDAEDWLDDPDVDTTEDPELAEPELPEDLDYQPPDMEAWDVMPVDQETPDAGWADDLAGLAGGGSTLPPSLPPGDGGGYVGVQHRQEDRYCTNRPEIAVRFQLPEWLKKLNLAKPGTEAFEKAFQERLAALKARGVDTSKLERFRQMLRNRSNRLVSPDELPTFLQSLGLRRPDTQDPAMLKEWRRKVADATDSFMLRLLHSDDPALIAHGLRARLGALGKFDEAAQEAAEAVIETIKADQKITEDFARVVPYLNIAISVHALYSGESLSGEKLGKIDRFLHTLTLAGPTLKLLRDPALRQGAAKLGNKAMWLGERTIREVSSRTGLCVNRLRKALGNFSGAVGNARVKAGEKLFGKVWAAEQRFLNSPAGRQAAELARQDARQAQSLLHRIAQARAAGDRATYRRLISALQGNKTAQGLLNSGKYSNEFRAALDRTHRAMGRLADRRTIAEVMTNPKVQKQIEALAKRHGMNPNDIVIRARNVSGNVRNLRNLRPGEMLRYGADRDVVFQFVHRNGRTLGDVHHKLVEKVYARNLRQITGRTLNEMDHVVTSRWHPEAYNPGRYRKPRMRAREIRRIISGRSAGRLGRPQDIRDTIVHKGKEWIEAGNKATARGRPMLGNQKVREGMRQMVKEYDRHVAHYLSGRGLDPAKALPPRLRAGMEVFRRAQKGLPVEQAREMLRALTPRGGAPVTPETIVDDLGAFVEFINKWGLRAGRDAPSVNWWLGQR